MNSKDKSKKMQRLLQNKDFQELILDDFIKQGALTHSLHDNVRSEAVLDEVIARRILHSWIFSVIETTDTL